MQVMADGEVNKSRIFPKQSLLQPITIPCFQVLITGLLDCQLRGREVAGGRVRPRRKEGGGEVGQSDAQLMQ